MPSLSKKELVALDLMIAQLEEAKENNQPLQLIGSSVNVVSHAASSAVNAGTNVASSAVSAGTNAASSAVNAGANAASSAVSAGTNAASSVVNAMISSINAVTDCTGAVTLSDNISTENIDVNATLKELINIRKELS